MTMAYQRIIIAVQCRDEDEKKAIQEMAKNLSQRLALKAEDIIRAYPLIEKNGELIAAAARMVSKNGPRGLVKLLPMLAKIKMR